MDKRYVVRKGKVRGEGDYWVNSLTVERGPKGGAA